MPIPAIYDLTIIQGADTQRRFALRTPAGTVMDLATTGDGYTIGTAAFRDEYSGDLLFDQLTTDNGGVSLTYEADANGTYWSGYIAVTAAISSGLTDWGDGVWDLEISDGLHVYRIAQGQCFLDPSVSE